MCGIAGIVSLNGSPLADRDLAAVEKMTSLLAHRGPDDSGVYIAPSHFAAFGHRRLSIIDLSEHGHQPYHCGGSSLVFNGEILNYRELAKKYLREEESSDTIVLAKLLEMKGTSVLPDIQGFFAFAHWNDEKKAMLIARDAIGKKPLYFAVAHNRLIFASELRPIVASGLVDIKIDQEALHLYLSYNSVASPHTMIANVKMLQPGHTIALRDNVMNVHQWWRLPKYSPMQASRAEVVSGVRERFTSSISARLISDAPLGLFHSGGIDSNAVLAAASEVSSAKLSTFNVRFGAQDSEESEVARLSAAHYSAAHTELSVKEGDVDRLLPGFFYRMDSPTGDGLNTFLVSHAVCELRPDIKVVLSGVGGDELFVGYKKVRMLAKLQALVRLLRSADVVRSSAWTTSRYDNLLHSLRHPLYLRQLFTSDERLALTGSDSSIERSIANRSIQLEDNVIQQVLRHDLENYLPHLLLRDLDVMTMAHQQEARAPFLDRELVEYAWQIALREKLKGRPKQLIIDAVGSTFPAAVLAKKKTGFELPVAQWLKHGFMRPMLNSLVKGNMELLRDGILQNEGVKRVAEDFLAGKTHYMRPWSIIALEYWYRSYTSGKSYEDWCSEPWPA